MFLKQVGGFVVAAALGASASATVVEFDFQGNAGFGLLPGNEVGANTSVGSDSPAAGREVFDGLVYNTDTNELDFAFEFNTLTGGLLDAASGIHFHLADADDPFNTNGPIIFNLNSGTDPNVTLENELITEFGLATAGTVVGTATLTETQEEQLFNGQFYLNIHSVGFSGGELRGNLVAVPEPASLALMGLGALAVAGRRRSAE